MASDASASSRSAPNSSAGRCGILDALDTAIVTASQSTVSANLADKRGAHHSADIAFNITSRVNSIAAAMSSNFVEPPLRTNADRAE